MEILSIFSAFGLSASAGLNAYVPLLVIGVVAHYTDWLTLNAPYDLLANPWVLIILGVLVIIEMVADKVPAVNHINDAIQTVIRPAAGAIAFAASTNLVSDLNPVLALILGLFIAGSVHTVKAAAVRPALTATTGGMANVPVSIAEDVVATVMSILAIVLPILMAVILVILFALVIWWFWNRARQRRAQTPQ
ncbi:MAG: DUF4126 domain-containing protein [Anaerolineales bacterium]|nr:DUF4126 domain-containing protein [Anaerolineales bacterium]